MTSWQDHVKQFRQKNPDLSFKEALIGASKTYKKHTKKKKQKKTQKMPEINIKPEKNERLVY